ncbi:helix-turn-helix transcriptional regulator [Streptomyces jumonjinensis]|uniref:Helix-turn-helix domain-containing protein n=1 Tax=Streptomyces jumonjinensis TaxID=1945 RepID=A0A646KRZ5_STRJU|nr:helix-turn-helix transcriptional regulator [Streptomyces jumonjinensis]MQT04807.1 helix-turn-helix domain-containing protein [Streptomyces jumonjinensis]
MVDGALAPCPDTSSEPLSPGQLLGHPGLLRAWRAVAGEKLGLGGPLSQAEVAEAIGRSRGWYQNLENGARPKTDRAVLDALAKTLLLGRDEHQALVLALLDGALTTIPDSFGSATVRRDLQMLLDQQLPNPAYLTDRVWNIIGYNAAMAALWPWVREPGANLIRWAMLSHEARFQYVDWQHHAAEYVKLLRYASTRYPHDTDLSKLITDVKADPVCGRFWDTDVAAVSESRDGHLFKMALPSMDYQPIEVISHVLFPASLPGARATVITWAGTDEDTAQGAVSGQPTDRTQERPSVLWPGLPFAAAEPTASPRLTATPAEAVELAGPRAVPLPLLGTLLGGDDCHLVLAPDTGSVIRTTRHQDGEWYFSETSAADLLRELRPTEFTGGTLVEYKLVLRASLPSDPFDASRACDTQLREARIRAETLAGIQDELAHSWNTLVPLT